MVFNSLEFPVFFLVVAIGMRLMPGGFGKRVWLLLASWYFYSLLNWWFAGLLVLTAAIHWGAARINRKWSMCLAVGASVGILAAFKYLGLWIDSIVMPVGISFYTFQAISYTVDVYKGRLDGRRSFIDVALYIGFFPQLLSGPIVRAGDFFPQLDSITNNQSPTTNYSEAFGQFAFGFFKKVFIADRMSMYVGRVFENCNLFDCSTLWLAAIAYTIQIYCDFSGYSDMAIGTARALGFEYKRNFDHPYLSTSLTEFWRRWHISLSTWLRDYIYIPLGGNRKGTFRQYLNQMITMLIGGAWHGADMSFVAWGGVHGLALCVHKWWTRLPLYSKVVNWRVWKLAAWALTMLTVVICWVLFRADTFSQAWTYISGMFHLFPTTIHQLPTTNYQLPATISWLHPHVYVAMALIALGCIRFHGKYISELRDVRKPLDFFFVFSVFALALLYPAGNASPFIYFQF